MTLLDIDGTGKEGRKRGKNGSETLREKRDMQMYRPTEKQTKKVTDREGETKHTRERERERKKERERVRVTEDKEY